MRRILLVVLACTALAGCGRGVSTADAINFNNAMVDAGKRVTDAGKAFGTAAGAAIGGGIQEVAKAKREFENAQEAVQRARSDVRTAKVPNSPAGKAFHEASLALLAEQEKLINEDFRAIVKVLEDPLLSPQERQKKIVPIARYIQSMDDLSAIRSAQAAFAQAHGFKVK